MTEPVATWACSQCGTLQDEAPACRRCRFDQLIDEIAGISGLDTFGGNDVVADFVDAGAVAGVQK